MLNFRTILPRGIVPATTTNHYEPPTTNRIKRKTNQHCAFHGCTNNSRFTPPEIVFHPFAKPCLKVSKGQEEATQSHIKQCPTCTKCNRWIMVGRGTKKWPKSVTEIKPSHYVCSLHFVLGHPYSDKFPDPSSATAALELRNKRMALQESIHAAKCTNVFGLVDSIQVPKSTDSANRSDIFPVKSETSGPSLSCSTRLEYGPETLQGMKSEDAMPSTSQTRNLPVEFIPIDSSLSSSFSERVVDVHNCTQCSYQAAYAFQLAHHNQRKHSNVNVTEPFHALVEPEPFSCSCCNYKSYYQFEIYKYFKQAHHSQAANNETVSSTGTYSCCYCKYESNSGLSLINHQRLCEKVPSMIQQKSTEEQVALKKSGRGNNSSEKDRLFKCDHCSYRSNKKINLKVHMISKHVANEDINRFCCDLCWYQAKLKSYLKRHVWKRDTGKVMTWFQCNHCSYRSRRDFFLKIHMLQHAKGKEIVWFHCSKCSYRSSKKRYLKKHRFKHVADEKLTDWFQCNRCPYQTYQKSFLNSHMLQHAADEETEWFSCGHCSYRSNRITILKTHMLTHADANDKKTNWMPCSRCPYRAKLMSALKMHVSRRHAKNDDIDWFQQGKQTVFVS